MPTRRTFLSSLAALIPAWLVPARAKASPAAQPCCCDSFIHPGDTTKFTAAHPISWDLDRALAELNESNRWIPVTERLPEPKEHRAFYNLDNSTTVGTIIPCVVSDHVLVTCVNGYVTIGMWTASGNSNQWVNINLHGPIYVTHWRPLPAPPTSGCCNSFIHPGDTTKFTAANAVEFSHDFIPPLPPSPSA